MSIEKSTLKCILDFYITLSEINDVIEQKNNAIKNQTFEKAAELRDLEVKLKRSLPTTNFFRELRNKLDEE